MASFAIALALFAACVACVPWRLWASRVAAAATRKSRARRTVVAADPSVAFCQATRELRVRIAELGELSRAYRRTLPYLSLFFADPGQGLHVRRDRWIVRVRAQFEDALVQLGEDLDQWRRDSRRLDASAAARFARAGGVPSTVGILLDDEGLLPASPAQARRFRFCEDAQAQHLQRLLDTLADDLGAIAAALEHDVDAAYR